MQQEDYKLYHKLSKKWYIKKFFFFEDLNMTFYSVTVSYTMCIVLILRMNLKKYDYYLLKENVYKARDPRYR